MAYNYYSPIGYPQTGMLNAYPQTSIPNSILWVNDVNEAMAYPVAPNGAVALWDRNAPCIYLKKADPTGRPSIQIYDLVERKEMPKKESGSQSDLYATKSDLAAISSTIKALEDRLEQMRLKMAHRGSGEGVRNDE